jgi:hypothetical protein
MEEQWGWVVCGRWIRRECAGMRRRIWWALVMVALVFVIIVDFDG